MALDAAKQTLEVAIKKAFDDAFLMGKNAGENDKSQQIRSDLAKDLTTAIHDYVKSAQVDITTVTSTVPAGVTIAGTGGGPVPVAGTTVAPGVAVHTGLGKLV